MRVFLITGFGLDKRAFELLQLPAEPFVLVDLIPVQKGERLPSYARRLSKIMDVAAGDIVGGVSLGGMLALEIAKIIPVLGVIQIASCMHPRFIKKRFLIFAPLAPYLPDFLVRKIFVLIPSILKWQNMLSPKGQALLADIMGKFPPSLLKSLPPMILHWSGCQPPVRFRHIHAEHDWLIDMGGPPSSLKIIPGKNHLITVSHPNEVRSFLLETVQEFLNDSRT